MNASQIHTLSTRTVYPRKASTPESTAIQPAGLTVDASKAHTAAAPSPKLTTSLTRLPLR
jgi:hypothetical protein